MTWVKVKHVSGNGNPGIVNILQIEVLEIAQRCPCWDRKILKSVKFVMASRNRVEHSEGSCWRESPVDFDQASHKAALAWECVLVWEPGPQPGRCGKHFCRYGGWFPTHSEQSLSVQPCKCLYRWLARWSLEIRRKIVWVLGPWCFLVKPPLFL